MDKKKNDDGGWFNVACELEELGEHEKAKALLVKMTTETERNGANQVLQRIAELLRGDDYQRVTAQIRAARKLPEGNEKREIFETIGNLTPALAAPLLPHLPDPLAVPGRPKGHGTELSCMIDKLEKRVRDTGQRPTTIAREIIGDVAGAKNRADTLVKAWKKRGKN